MNNVIFSLGTNIGDRLSHLVFAKNMLCQKIGELVSCSSIYQSPAWGNTNQKNFLNQVLVYKTEKSAETCLDMIQFIENERLRERNVHWGPRTLDIDILFFNQEIFNSQRLIIPHPFIEKRLFVLLPLSEILPDYIHPVSKQSILDLLDTCEDKSKLTKYINGT